MTISIFAVFTFLAKLLVLAVISLFSAAIILWPINDQPTSKTQKLLWLIVVAVATLTIFTDLIHWTR